MLDQTVVFLISGKKQHGKDSLYKVGKGILNWDRVAFADKIKEICSEMFRFTPQQVDGKLKDIEDERYPNSYDPKTKLVDFTLDPKLLSAELKVHNAKVYTPNEQYKPNLSPRRVFQIIGKEFRRLYPKAWVAYVFETRIPYLINLTKEAKDLALCAPEFYSQLLNIAVTDVRYPNEIYYAEAWAAKKPDVRKIVKIRVIRTKVKEDENSKDESETALDTYKDWDFIIYNDGTLEELEEKINLLTNKLSKVLTKRSTPTVLLD